MPEMRCPGIHTLVSRPNGSYWPLVTLLLASVVLSAIPRVRSNAVMVSNNVAFVILVLDTSPAVCVYDVLVSWFSVFLTEVGRPHVSYTVVAAVIGSGVLPVNEATVSILVMLPLVGAVL